LEQLDVAVCDDYGIQVFEFKEQVVFVTALVPVTDLAQSHQTWYVDTAPHGIFKELRISTS